MNTPTQPLIPQTPIKTTFEIQEPYIQNPTGIASSRLPMTAYCIFCKKNIETEVTYHTGRSTHFMGGLTCLLGFYCCCCCLPYHLKDCKDARHHCPHCASLISIKKFTIL